MTSRKDRTCFHIDDLLVQPDRNAVIREEQEIRLEPRMMDVLVELAENAGKTVSKGALLEEFWSDDDDEDAISEENPVTKTMSILRKRIGDDARKPRYIETVSKIGYRLIAAVHFPEGYRHNHREFGTWTKGNPYVGLTFFDDRHSEVFQGRSRTIADLGMAIREQIDNQRRLVLIVGPSGCGKTSLLRAALIPAVGRQGGFDGLRALSIATCDLGTASDGDAMGVLAAALAGWSLGDRTVFPPLPPDELKKLLSEAPEKIAGIVEEGFRRHVERGLSDQPYAHLLLTIDHAEMLVAGRGVDAETRNRFARVVRALCDTPRTFTAMISRLDFYPFLADALPELAEYRSGHGHFEVSAPSQGELAKIIRKPAALAGVEFEEHPTTQVFLDDQLCRKSIDQPDALPLLQHALHSLYERCGKTGLLTYAAFEEIGGLEGAIARRAEQVFGELPTTIQASLERILARLVVIQPDSGAVSASPVLRNRLDPEARELAQAFVDAHLFVSDLDAGQPIVRVAHEALLRQWPRAADWIKENLRLLQARARLQHAAERWKEGGCREDHLLNPGRPLSESQEVLAKMPDDLKPEVHALIAASGRSDRRRRRLRKLAIGLLAAFGVSSTALAITAYRAKNEAEAGRLRMELTQSFMLEEIAGSLEHIGDLTLIEKISTRAIEEYGRRESRSLSDADLVNLSRALRIRGSVRQKRGDDAASLADFRRARPIAMQAAATAKDPSGALYELAQINFWFGRRHYVLKDFNTARTYWEEYLEASSRLRSIDKRNAIWTMEESYAINLIASIFYYTGDPESALTHFNRSLDLKLEAIDASDRDEWRKDLADTRAWIGMCLESLGRLDEASTAYSRAISDLEPIVERHPDNREWAHQLSKFRQLDAIINHMMGRHQRAKHSIESSIDTQSKLSKSDRSHSDWSYYLATAHQIAGDIENALGNREESIKNYTESTRILKIIRSEREYAPRERRLSATLRLGLFAARKETEDLKIVEEATRRLQDLHAEIPDDVSIARAYIESLFVSGVTLKNRGDRSSANEKWKRILSVTESHSHKTSHPTFTAARAVARLHLGDKHAAKKDIELLERIGFRHPVFISELAGADSVDFAKNR